MGSDHVVCIHRQRYGECFVCMMLVVDQLPVCPECGNDVVCEGLDLCSDCLLEENDEDAPQPDG